MIYLYLPCGSDDEYVDPSPAAVVELSEKRLQLLGRYLRAHQRAQQHCRGCLNSFTLHCHWPDYIVPAGLGEGVTEITEDFDYRYEPAPLNEVQVMLVQQKISDIKADVSLAIDWSELVLNEIGFYWRFTPKHYTCAFATCMILWKFLKESRDG